MTRQRGRWTSARTLAFIGGGAALFASYTEEAFAKAEADAAGCSASATSRPQGVIGALWSRRFALVLRCRALHAAGSRLHGRCRSASPSCPQT